ncbi:hypothetical protein TrLO_g9993 [Triparma laevis f. longispina]|uniref:Importin-7/11-like TPR repeats domain-containing protein n=1 Tax=Triparma laevis f. longispina TaxID=1714387 RepID=A0A9W7ASU2_9STRA|nr:hypothetical protein TrLO_g9993 [Triparma laevis f. longispina]
MLVSTLRGEQPFQLTMPLRKGVEVLVAKIGRFDSMMENPSLIPTLLHSLPTSTFTASCFNKLLKELSTQRLLLHKKNFSAISNLTFPTLAQLFVSSSSRLGEGDDFLEWYNLICKILQKLIGNTMQSLVAGGENIKEGEGWILEKLVINCCGFLARVKGERAYDPSSLTGNSSNSFSHKTITSKGDTNTKAAENNLQIAVAACGRFYTEEVCEILAKIAICAMMPLTRRDLEEWQNDPEQYMVSVEQATISTDAHAAGQQLFLTLQESSHRPLLSKFLLSFLNDYNSQISSASLEANSMAAMSVQLVGDLKVLQWDAIFTAAGIAASSLEDQIDFTDWFCKALAPALTTIMQSPSPPNPNPNPNNTALPVLRHRIVWLLGCYVNSLSDALRPQIYSALVSVLNHDSVKSDAMVKLTCVKTLNGLFEDWDFDIPAFHLLSAPTIRGLYALLDRVEELESSTLILQTASVLIARMGMSLGVEAANAVVLPLLQIWEMAGDKNVLRKHVLSILTNVSAAVTPEEVALLYPVVQPMLDLATNPGDAHVYLTDDALRLWLALMRVAREYDEGFHLLFPKISNIVINMDWEHLKVCMLILESYIFVGKQTFWNQMFLSLVGNVKAKAATYIMLPIDALMRRFPLEGSQMLLEGGVYNSILKCCVDVIRDAKEREPDIILVQWISIVGRGLIVNRDTIIQGLFKPQGVCSPTEFLNLMLEKFDSTGYGWGKTGQIRRRVWVCALASLLPGADGPVGGPGWEGVWDTLMLKNLDQFVNMCVDVLTEDAAGSVGEGEQFYDSEEDTPISGAEEYEKKLRTEIQSDSVVAVNLKTFVKARIDGCAIVVGPARWREAIESCEPVVVQQLMKLLN